MAGIIGKKLGMTSIFSADGKNIPCTLIEAGPCVVTQVKTSDKDGYEALQIGYGDKKEKHTPKPMQGHFAKAGTTPKRKLVEVPMFNNLGLGDTITADVFEEGDWIDVTGTSKGKGFQGVVKRHGFGGVGQSTHGQHNRMRAPGSVGAASYPARVFKGMKMAGQTGNKKATAINLQIVKVLADKNIIAVKGSVPGAKGSIVVLEK